MKQVLRSLKHLAFPFIRLAFARRQRARPTSRFVRASFDPTARALIRAGTFFLVGFGLIWSEVIGCDRIILIDLNRHTRSPSSASVASGTGRCHRPPDLQPPPNSAFCILPSSFLHASVGSF